MTQQPAHEEITVKAAAGIAGVDVRTVRRWVKSGLVPGRKIGEGRTSAYLVSKQSLEEYLATKQRDQAAT